MTMAGFSKERGNSTEANRSARKRRAILDAATEVFLKSGYLGTNMDEIAALSEVSKQTVYKHFASKEALFVEIVTSMTDEAGDIVHDEMAELDDGGDVAEYLFGLCVPPAHGGADAAHHAVAPPGDWRGQPLSGTGEGALRTRTRSVRCAALAATFERLDDRGLLAIDDPSVAASQFNWLIMSAPLNQAMLLGDAAIPKPASFAAMRRKACAYSSRHTASSDRRLGSIASVPRGHLTARAGVRPSVDLEAEFLLEPAHTLVKQRRPILVGGQCAARQLQEVVPFVRVEPVAQERRQLVHDDLGVVDLRRRPFGVGQGLFGFLGIGDLGNHRAHACLARRGHRDILRNNRGDQCRGGHNGIVDCRQRCNSGLPAQPLAPELALYPAEHIGNLARGIVHHLEPIPPERGHPKEVKGGKQEVNAISRKIAPAIEKTSLSS